MEEEEKHVFTYLLFPVPHRLLALHKLMRLLHGSSPLLHRRDSPRSLSVFLEVPNLQERAQPTPENSLRGS